MNQQNLSKLLERINEYNGVLKRNVVAQWLQLWTTS